MLVEDEESGRHGKGGGQHEATPSQQDDGPEQPRSRRSGLEARLQRTLQELSSYQAELEAQNRELRISEARVRDARARFSSLFDLAPTGNVVLDEGGRIEFTNACFRELLGCDHGDVHHDAFASLIAPSHRVAMERYLETVQREPLSPLDTILMTEHGSACPVRLWAAPLYGDGRGLIMAVTDRRDELAAQRMQREFVHRLLSTQDEERRRVARELHDEAGQTLTAIEIGLRRLSQSRTLAEATDQAESLDGLVRQAGDELRRLARGLHPALLDDLGLSPALERLVAEQRAHTGVPVELSLAELDPPSKEFSLTIYRVVQEALSNALRHGHPGRVTVSVSCEGAVAHLYIRDNGRGFRLDERHGAGLGLQGMRERVEKLGGALRIDSAPGAGTIVHASVPMERRT